jgi:hypothetical protein
LVLAELGGRLAEGLEGMNLRLRKGGGVVRRHAANVGTDIEDGFGIAEQGLLHRERFGGLDFRDGVARVGEQVLDQDFETAQHDG